MTRTELANRFATLPGLARAGVWMSVSALAYAVSIAIGRYLAPDIAVFQIAFMRNACAVVLMLPWLYRVGLGAMRTQQLGRHVVRGLLSSLNMSLLFAAVALIPIADMAAINFLQPLIGVVVAAVVLGELVGRQRWLAIALGLCGALIVTRPGFGAFNLGTAFALGSAATGAVVAILIKTMVRSDPPDTIAAWLFLTQTIFLLVPTIIVWRTPSRCRLISLV